MTQANTITLDGIELSESQPGAWTYVPTAPSFERGPDGKLLFGVVATGTIAFLQATARLDLSDTTTAMLLQRLRETRPDARTIRSAIDGAPRVALEIKGKHGSWTTLFERASSGLPPYLTALAGALHPEQLAAVKAALGGERGRLRLAARATLAPTPGGERRSRSFTEVRVETSSTAATSTSCSAESAATGGAPARAFDLSKDVAEFFPPSG